MKRKMILMVPMLHQGGFERVCVLTARLLNPCFDVTIVVFDLKDLAYDIEGLSVICLDMGVKEGKLGKIWNVWKRSRRVKKIREEIRPDIVYSFGPTANLVNVFSRGVGEVWCGVRSYMDLDSPRKLQMFARYSHRLVCCSKGIEGEIRAFCPEAHLVTLHNPYSIAEIRQKAKESLGEDYPFSEENKVIVSMGREDDVKGFWHLLKAFSLVADKETQARLMIIGEGDFKEYRRLAGDLGVEDKVFFTGVQKNPFQYLTKAAVYVLTSYYEGFPNALVEAMALEIPVIATDCKTGPKEILLENSEYGILIPNMNPEKNLDASVIEKAEEALAEQIVTLLADKELYESYCEKARIRAEYFSYEKYASFFREYMN